MHIWVVFYLHSTYPQWVEIHFETGLPNLNIFNYIPCYGFFFPCYGLDWFFFENRKEGKPTKSFHHIIYYIWIAYERDSCTKQRRKNPLSCKVFIHKSRGGVSPEYVSWPTQNSLSILRNSFFLFKKKKSPSFYAAF